MLRSLARTATRQAAIDPRPGRYLLTGSARVLSMRAVPDALPGRMETVELWPLSQGEIDDKLDRFVDAAFALCAIPLSVLWEAHPPESHR